jgi:hypothetical protein
MLVASDIATIICYAAVFGIAVAGFGAVCLQAVCVAIAPNSYEVPIVASAAESTNCELCYVL